MSATLFRAAFDAMHYSGAAAAAAPIFRGLGVIYCLHHVRPATRQDFAPNSNLEITPEFLDEFLTSVKAWGYDLVSLTDAARRIAEPGGRPFAVFTLDDGYRDNLVHAMPVFKRHAAPFAVFVSPNIIDGTCEMWWRALEAVIANHPVIEVPGHGIIRTESTADKQRAWTALAGPVQAMAEYAQRQMIRELSDRYGVDLRALCLDNAMTWDEVRRMASDPIATIGAHTLNHYTVSKLEEADARREIVESGKRLEAELQRPIEHFAYPYGNVAHAGPRDFRLCREAGYLTAVTTRLGTVQAAHAGHMHALPRVMVSGKYQKSRYLKTLTSGLPGRLFNGFRAVSANSTSSG